MNESSPLLLSLESRLCEIEALMEDFGRVVPSSVVQEVRTLRAKMNRVRQEEAFMSEAKRRLGRADAIMIPVTHGRNLVFTIPKHARRDRGRRR